MKNSKIVQIAQEVFRKEIKELTNISDNLNDNFAKATDLILKSKGKVVLVGIGKSAHIANKIAATLNSTGTPSQFLHASEAIHGDLGLVREEDVIICISKSGNTPEIKHILPFLKKQSKAIIGLTGNLQSELAKFSDAVLDVSISEEACPNNLAPTSSTTAQLVMGDALAVALMILKNFSSEDFAKYHPGGALGKKLLWNVEDIIDNYLKPMVNLNSGINEVIDSLARGRNGITVVMDGENIKGVITDGDLRRMLQKHKEFHNLTAKDIATMNPKTIYKDEKAVAALNKLQLFDVGQLIVIDRDDKYYGILDFHTLISEGIEE